MNLIQFLLLSLASYAQPSRKKKEKGCHHESCCQQEYFMVCPQSFSSMFLFLGTGLCSQVTVVSAGLQDVLLSLETISACAEWSFGGFSFVCFSFKGRKKRDFVMFNSGFHLQGWMIKLHVWGVGWGEKQSSLFAQITPVSLTNISGFQHHYRASSECVCVGGEWRTEAGCWGVARSFA